MGTYLIFVIFFTLAKFLENKIYTEKLAFFGVNFIFQKFCQCKKNDKYEVCILEHKTFGLAINRDYLSTVFTSDHPCPEYIVYYQYTGGLRRNQHQKQKMARPINREGNYFMLYYICGQGRRYRRTIISH